MEALQYIYTSWKNGDSTEKGYMIYSRSQGITEEECAAIKCAMQYMAPKEMTPAPTPEEIVENFPYAFAYFRLPTGRGCVAQSTYLGKDYSGRYGNYIIYALVYPMDMLPCLPAELFAEDYIKTYMTEQELNAPSPVPPLPPLEIESYGSVINDDQLSEFLFDKEEEFAQLLSLVLAARDQGVPFYLNDTRENLVLWAAAIQRVLPERLAKQFAFNTYVGDHESLRSQKAKELGLDFCLVGVRPDANYFSYSSESKSNRQVVMDFLGGHMTPDILPLQYARAMASSITMDFEDIENFGLFLESTSFDEISGKLEDAYACYELLRNDSFEFTAQKLSAVLSFADRYCSEGDCGDMGSKLLMKCQEESWYLTPKQLLKLWKFVCKYTSFMIYSLYDLFTDLVYQHAGEATEPCLALAEMLQQLQQTTPQQYSDYLTYLNTPDSAEHLMVYLQGHTNPCTCSFYIAWLLDAYPFAGGLTDGQPISKVLANLLKNISLISGGEKQMVEVLLSTANNKLLFEHSLRIFLNALTEPQQLDRLCSKYVEAAEAMSDAQQNHFERLLLDTPGAGPFATRLCARTIGHSRDPEKEFWRIYENQRRHAAGGEAMAVDPMIRACLKRIEEKDQEDVAIDILRKIDYSLITDSETITLLTNVVNGCGIKTLAKLGDSFLQGVIRLREQVEQGSLRKLRAVCFGETLRTSNQQRRQPTGLAGEAESANVRLKYLDKSDYETYLKLYFEEYLLCVHGKEDIPVLMQMFFHEKQFSGFVDDLISAIKKLEKKEPGRWKRLLGWLGVYLSTAERTDEAAEALFKPVVRYMRTLDEQELAELRQVMLLEIPSAKFEHLFDEVRRKEGFAEKLGNIFKK